MSDNASHQPVLQLTAQIISAHASHNHITQQELLHLIGSVYTALAAAGSTPAAGKEPEPAVPVKRSVFPDHIICLEDGKKLKMLKRHLMTTYQLTPDQYRAKWHLPASYPMVAPEYAARRSALAKEIGLGRKAVASPQRPPVAPPRRGRPPKQRAAD